MNPYIHRESIHNLNAPSQIVPLLVEIFSPKSVVDIGCGIGTFLKAFKEHHVADVLGVDGPWANEKLVSKYLTPDEFIQVDLENAFGIKRKFDLALCLEVAEHLSPNKSRNLVENLVSVSDVIIFSAAVPYQGGQNHVNEQWVSYWQELFADYNYVFKDGLRQILWDNPRVETWYKQKIFIVAKSNQKIELKEKLFERIKPIQTYIHPDEYTIKAGGYANFYGGKLKSKVYLKLLLKSLLRKKLY